MVDEAEPVGHPFPRDFGELADLADTLPPPVQRDLEPPAGPVVGQPPAASLQTVSVMTAVTW